jgi:GDP-4-dehydro-6-deoxy-D-mannose reductase
LRVLITGASGFAGGYLARACAEAGDEVIGVSRRRPPGPGEARELDLRDQAAVRALLGDVQPDVIYHLAAQSSVGRSWQDPTETVEVNVASAVNILEAWRLDAPRARMVWISSCEVYGNAAQLPIVEDAPVQPANPYAVSKLTGDLLAGVYADAHGLDLVRARPFNHAGPGQRPVFIVSSLARQAAEGRLSGAHRIRIATGNPDTRRDFTDVRDVVRGYRLLAERARPGVYNVCSGRSISPADQIRMLAEVVAPLEIEHEVDPARVRAHEVMDLRGSNARIRSAVGWQPEIPFEQTIRDTVQWWVQELEPAADGAARS